MNCPNCGKEIHNQAQFCRFCGTAVGEPVMGDAPEEPIPKKKGHLKWIFAVAICLLLAGGAGGAVLYNHFNDTDIAFSDSVEALNLKDSYALDDDKIDLSYPAVDYQDGTKDTVKKYTAYINGTPCEVKKGKVCVPDNVPTGNCTLRLEWEKDGKTEYCQKSIHIEKPEQETTEKETETTAKPKKNAGSFEELKQELIAKYGQAEIEQKEVCDEEGNSVTVKGDTTSAGIIGFYEMDIDKDKTAELLCVRAFELDEEFEASDGFFGQLDCRVYAMENDAPQCVYSTYESGYPQEAGGGGMIIKDGTVPHFALTNRGVPMELFKMEDGKIVEQDIDAPEGTEDMCSAELYGVLQEVYEDAVGGAENYETLLEIEGSDYYFTVLEDTNDL